MSSRLKLLLLALILYGLLPSPARAQVPLTDLLSPAEKLFDDDGTNFDILTKLLAAAELTQVTLTTPNITLFAPNDAAFVRTAKFAFNYTGNSTDEEAVFKVLAAFAEKGIQAGNRTVSGVPLLQAVLLYHAAKGVLKSGDLVANIGPILTVAEPLTIFNVGTGELVDKSIMTPNPGIVAGKFDIMVQNNVVVHVIDAVLLPLPIQVPLESLFSCN